MFLLSVDAFRGDLRHLVCDDDVVSDCSVKGPSSGTRPKDLWMNYVFSGVCVTRLSAGSNRDRKCGFAITCCLEG